MVAQTIELPNIRKLFLPDPGYVICDCDLPQADARVVAWEADDAKLKAIFNDPEADLHTENCLSIFGTFSKRGRFLAKSGVHATNYGASPPTLAKALGISIREAEDFQHRWFSAHPGIYDWHRRVEHALQTTRTITNIFGYRRVYFDRPEQLLPQALAWIPQSSVALTIDKMWDAVCEKEKDFGIQVLFQVHDSLVFQLPKSRFHEALSFLEEAFTLVLPYPDPMIIQAGLSASEKTWGDCKDMSWAGK
jgi:DNA polymerase I-like protein with 3'-5' exonuclease and polymerase domains